MRRSSVGAVIVSWLAATALAAAQETAPETAPAPAPEAAPETPPPDDAFDMLVLPVRVDPALDIWTHVPTEVGPSFAEVSSICPNEQVMVLVLFRNIGDLGDGKGHVTLEFTQTGPDGEVGLHQSNVQAWDGPLPPPNIVALSQATMGIMFDDEEPLGPMHFTLSAHDEARDVTLEKSFDLSLEPWTYGEQPASVEEYHSWQKEYFRTPRPAQAVRAFLEYETLEQGDTGDWNYATAGFFRAVFEDSPWLLEHLVEAARQGSEDRKVKAAILLHLVDQDARLADLQPDASVAATVRDRFAKAPLPDAYGPLTRAGQIDLLWGEFLATGRYRPIRQIVGAMQLLEDPDPLKTFQASAQTDADKATLQRGLAAQSAFWSLRSQMKQHPLVCSYGLWMLQHDGLDAREGDFLRYALKEVRDARKAAAAEAVPPR